MSLFAVLTLNLVASTGMTTKISDAEFLEPLRPFVESVASSVAEVPESRRELLQSVAEFVVAEHEAGRAAQLVFICTHNSRRSHLGQVWCRVAAHYYGIPGVETFSGGTEATACNIRTVRALRRAGLSIVASDSVDNPRYLIQYAEATPVITAWSKKYDCEDNPEGNFAAMMCCGDADEKCPLIPGATARFALLYKDPKSADGTPAEASRYDERSRQIAMEMFYVMHQVAVKKAESP